MKWLRNFLTSRYTLFLEAECIELKREMNRQRAENDKLREENRGLVNSLLGTAGHEPMALAPPRATPRLARRRSWHQMQQTTVGESVKALRKQAEVGKNGEAGSEAAEASGTGAPSGATAA